MTLRIVDGQIVETTGPKPSVSFYEHAKKVGPGKYVPVDYIEIRSPGVRDFMSRPANAEDRKQYAKEWEAYQSGLAKLNDETTPLSALPAFKTAFGLELASNGIHTVEELALCESCPIEGLELLHKQAKRYVLLKEDSDEPEQAEA